MGVGREQCLVSGGGGGLVMRKECERGEAEQQHEWEWKIKREREWRSGWIQRSQLWSNHCWCCWVLSKQPDLLSSSFLFVWVNLKKNINDIGAMVAFMNYELDTIAEYPKDRELRDGWPYQNAWIFGKIPNGLDPNFWKIIMRFFLWKTHFKALYNGPKSAI